MNKTINQLDEIESLATSDELAIWDNSASETKKVPASEIKSLVITATSTTVTGAKLMAGSVVKILFTSAITGSDTTTGMSISYNGTSIPVKVGKNGSLADFVASDISGTYTYLQAYTTLELAFDGTQFIIIGNPVVISSADYTIYADGSQKYNRSIVDKKVDLIGYSELNGGEVISTIIARDINTAGKGYNSTIRLGAYCTGAYDWCYPALQMSRNDADTERITIFFSPDGYITFINNGGEVIRRI